MLYLFLEHLLMYIKKNFFSALNHIGIKGVEDYRKYGDWFGNSSMDGPMILKSVTYPLSNLLESISVHYQNGDITVADEEFNSFKTRMIPTWHYGRCYEIKFEKRKQNIDFVDVISKKKIVIYFNLAGQFYTNSRSFIPSNTGENMYVEVPYEILKSNHDPRCQKYSNLVSKSYDSCKASNMHEKIQSEFNCTVPFLMKTGIVII